METSLDASACNDIIQSYGIKAVSEAFDPEFSPTLKTIGSLGKKSYFTDGFGNKVSDSNIDLPLLPKSNLSYINNYLSSKNWSPESLAGHVGETYAADALRKAGYSVIFPDKITQKGYDLLLPKSFFDDNNLPYIPPHTIGLRGNPELGVLQVKTVNSSRAVLEHFKKFPDIPVTAPDNVVLSPELESYKNLLIPFSKLGGGIDYTEIIENTSSEMDMIARNCFGDIIKSGYEIDQIKEAIDGYYGTDIPDLSGINLPIFGMVLTGILSYRRAHLQVKAGEILNIKMAINVTSDVAGAGVRGMAGMAASSFVATNILMNEGGVNEVFGDTFNSFGDSLDMDFNIEDAINYGQLALVIATGYYAIKGVSYTITKIKSAIKWVGELFDDYVQARKAYEKAIKDFNLEVNEKHVFNIILSLLGNKHFEFHKKRLEYLSGKYTKVKACRIKLGNKLPSIYEMFLRHAFVRLNKFAVCLEESYRKSRCGIFYYANERILRLNSYLVDMPRSQRMKGGIVYKKGEALSKDKFSSIEKEVQSLYQSVPEHMLNAQKENLEMLRKIPRNKRINPIITNLAIVDSMINFSIIKEIKGKLIEKGVKKFTFLDNLDVTYKELISEIKKKQEA